MKRVALMSLVALGWAVLPGCSEPPQCIDGWDCRRLAEEHKLDAGAFPSGFFTCTDHRCVDPLADAGSP